MNRRQSRRRTASAEVALHKSEKRRLTAWADRDLVSEGEILRRLLLPALDAAGIVDPGEPEDDSASLLDAVAA